MDKRIISAFSKLINSDVIKDVYPMLERIEIVDIVEHPHRMYEGYNMNINIFLNDPSINEENIFQSDLDPLWLTDRHITDLSKYLGFRLYNIHFKLYGYDGDLIMTSL
jgi:hypothetical protein